MLSRRAVLPEGARAAEVDTKEGAEVGISREMAISIRARSSSTERRKRLIWIHSRGRRRTN